MNSVVRVRGYDEFDEPGGYEQMQGVGTGVVVIDNGTILTNLHVVSGSKRVTVTFFDGSESDVELLKTYPENDLAVIRAKTDPRRPRERPRSARPRTCGPATRWSRSDSRSASAPRRPRAWCPGWTAPSARRRASR